MSDKKRKVDNLVNLVENHIRTERHLEQYSNIGDPKYRDMAREKQNVREEQINVLKNQLTNEHPKISPSEHLENLKESYERNTNYLQNNMGNLSYEQISNMATKQKNQRRQMEQLSKDVDESGKYTKL
ncbi:MAG: hypothetical protein IJX99_07795 [Clostridia bacterium]|nr:hypothetical protein [Clostridia bacterium]